MLSAAEIEHFIEKGFVRLEQAFPRELADQGRALLWRDTGCSPDDPATWAQPVVRLGFYPQEPFRLAANTPRLHGACDQLVGPGRWQRQGGLGTFPVRFPHPQPPGDDGWHVDTSFPGDNPSDYFSWRSNLASKGRALLMLFLFSDVGPDDAPTRLRVGSHLQVARLLAPAGEAGLSFMELARQLGSTEGCPLAQAEGEAGTVYLCHPFLAHAAQPHRGTRPRFMAQPPLLPSGPFTPSREGSPVERAIALAIG